MSLTMPMHRAGRIYIRVLLILRIWTILKFSFWQLGKCVGNTPGYGWILDLDLHDKTGFLAQVGKSTKQRRLWQISFELFYIFGLHNLG